MNARVLDTSVTVYAQPPVQSLATMYAEPTGINPIAEIQMGAEVELCAFKKTAGQTWICVSLHDGRTGYISGKTKVFAYKTGKLLESSAEVHAEPKADSAVIARLARHAAFQVIDVVEYDDTAWYKIRDAQSVEGFISARIQIDDRASTRWARTSAVEHVPLLSKGYTEMLWALLAEIALFLGSFAVGMLSHRLPSWLAPVREILATLSILGSAVCLVLIPFTVLWLIGRLPREL